MEKSMNFTEIGWYSEQQVTEIETLSRSSCDAVSQRRNLGVKLG